MATVRRAISLVLVLLAAPSVLWSVFGLFVPIPSFPEWRSLEWWLQWAEESFFVFCFLLASVILWKGFRIWPVVLLVVTGLQTYLVAGSFVLDVLLVPSHFASYVPLVLKEATNRGATGTSLVWSLLVLPLALPALLLTSVWLCFATRPFTRHASNP